MDRPMCTHPSQMKGATEMPAIDLQPTLCCANHITSHKQEETDIGFKASRVSKNADGKQKNPS